MTRAHVVLLALFALLMTVCQSTLGAQDPAPALDAAPLVRPAPVASGAVTNPRALLVSLKTKAEALGFRVADSDNANLTFTVERQDPRVVTDYDRAVIWLERDPVDPLVRVRLYLLYGRFEEVWSRAGKSVQRIRVTPEYEEVRVGQLKRALRNLVDPQT